MSVDHACRLKAETLEDDPGFKGGESKLGSLRPCSMIDEYGQLGGDEETVLKSRMVMDHQHKDWSKLGESSIKKAKLRPRPPLYFSGPWSWPRRLVGFGSGFYQSLLLARPLFLAIPRSRCSPARS